MNKSAFRAIFTYFFVVYLTSCFALFGRWGWLSLLWALLALLVFAVPIPAPYFVHKILTHRKISVPTSWYWACFGAAYGLVALWASLQAGSVLAGLLMGVLYYGYPGALLMATVLAVKGKG